MLMCGDLDGLLERVHNEQSFLVFIEALGADFAQERTLTIPSSPTELEQVAGKTAPSIRILKQLPLGQSAVTGAPPILAGSLAMEEERGYPDIIAEDCWNEWQRLRSL